MKNPLFEPISINRMKVKNRINMPAMHLNMCRDFEVTDQMVAFYAERAKGGAGMITVGYATVDEYSGAPLCLGAHRDAFIPGLTRLADVIQSNGARAMVQINHAGRYAHSLMIGNRQPLAPSAIPSRLTRETPREMKAEDIEAVIESFAQAARRVKTAGFDAVEVLSGTGYLISEFLSPLTNQRQDAYGGPLENRMRFGLEIIAAIRNMVGNDFPIVVRMNGNDFMPGGNGREELQKCAIALARVGVDALNINVGWHEARVPQITTAVPRGAFAYLSRGIKQEVNIPVMAGHRVHDTKTAGQLIADGMCDLVSMGRALIADPRMPEKALAGREKKIRHCIACGQGCFDRIQRGKPIECLCNPVAGHELACRMETTNEPKKVMVVGGGAAGMSAALAASECGHRVVLYEKRESLGGQLRLAAAPPGREEFRVLSEDLARQVMDSDVKVVFGRTVDLALVQDESPDAVILATGATPIVPPIAGVNLPHVVQAWDVLSDKVITGSKVIVVGGGAVGVETALFLAEKGTLPADALQFLFVHQAEDPDFLYELATRGTKSVVLVEMISKVGMDIGKTTRWTMIQELDRRGVLTHVKTKVLEITEDGVKVEQDGKEIEISGDTVVLAAGATPHNPLQKELEAKGIACRVAGDAEKIGLAFDAVHTGFATGRSLHQ